jgi:hypothetical protein
VKNKIVHGVTKLFFGSAVAGAGFSLGRDIYRLFKKNLLILIGVFAALFFLALPYIAASKLFFYRPLSKLKWCLIVLIPWSVLGSVGLIPVVVGFTYFKSDVYTFHPEIPNGTLYGICYWLLAFLLGALVSKSKRAIAKEAYEIEVFNESFMKDNGILEVDGAASFTHEDAEGNKLRLDGIGRDLVEFFVIGKRGKRAFIYLDESGRFSQYSGIVSI